MTPDDLETHPEPRDPDTRSRHRRGRADSGMSFIEVLVSIVLIGTTLIGVLAATRATIIGTKVERDHSRAQQWLQSAVGVLDGTDLESCITPADGSAILSSYQAAVADPVDGARRPPGWNSSATIEVLDLQVWNGNTFVPFDQQGATCLDTVELRQQRITIRVTSPDGEIVEDIEVIKRDL